MPDLIGHQFHKRIAIISIRIWAEVRIENWIDKINKISNEI